MESRQYAEGVRRMTRLSENQARKLLGDKYPEPKKSKYHSRKTTIDYITFYSKKEADYYCQLKLRKQAGDIIDFELQPEFVLQEAYKRNGKTIRAIKYRADFRIIHKNFDVEIVDVKGHKTKEYKIKKKMLLFRYPEIWFTEV